MSLEYDQYLSNHRANFSKAFNWIYENIPEILQETHNYNWQISLGHDLSKDLYDEYEAYDAYFYGINKSFEVVNNFNKAWLLHIHRNPHHWQYWVLLNDDPEEGENVLEMPYIYLIEMICDWWSFSLASANPYEIFNWYKEHKDHIKLHSNTKEKVEMILELIKNKLYEIKEKEDESDK